MSEEAGEHGNDLNDLLESVVEQELEAQLESAAWSDLDATVGDESEVEFEDRAGSVNSSEEGDEVILSWVRSGEKDSTEMLRYDRVKKLIRIFPKVRRNFTYENPFAQITELQIPASRWDPEYHSTESQRLGLLHVNGLPRGFSTVWEFGLGVMRHYRGLLEEIEERSPCTTIRFGSSSTDEGPDGDVFHVDLERFEAYRAVVDRNRGRGSTVVSRVIDAERHNAVADLFGLDHMEPQYGRNAVIRAMTEEVVTGYVTNPADRATLVDQVTRDATKVAQESPERFGRLREDIELVSLEVLIEQFDRHVTGRGARSEQLWQEFFQANQFALQQVFAAPIVVLLGQAHVKGTDVLGSGSRIADFLCVNAVTRGAIVVEIKTPASKLMAAQSYRGNGTAEVYPTHKDLSGAVSQVQAQMESVPRHLKKNAQLGVIDKWHVRGAVITGKVSELNEEQRASFLRYREGLTAVTVLGYDEVGERLRYLHAMLKSPPTDGEDVAVQV